MINHAKIEKAAAIHMNANISLPIDASMLRSVSLLNTFLMMMKRTVAMTAATVMINALRKVKMASGNVAQREA